MPLEETAATSPAPAAGPGDAARGDPGGNVMDKARQAAMSRLESQKSKAAESVGGVAESLRQAGRGMEGGSLPVAQYVHGAADQLETLSRTLNEKGMEDLLVDAENFARRQPALFMGLAFAAGLAGARFLKSSSRSTTMADRVRETIDSTSSNDGTRDASTRYSEPVTGRRGGW